jgi:hypothetical protein
MDKTYIESVYFQDYVLAGTDSDKQFIIPRLGKIVKVKYYLSDSMKSTVSVNLNLINRKASINGLPFYSIGNSAILGMEENFTLTFNTKIDVKSRDTIQMFTHNTGLFDTQVSASVDIQYADNEGVTE